MNLKFVSNSLTKLNIKKNLRVVESKNVDIITEVSK